MSNETKYSRMDQEQVVEDSSVKTDHINSNFLQETFPIEPVFSGIVIDGWTGNLELLKKNITINKIFLEYPKLSTSVLFITFPIINGS